MPEFIFSSESVSCGHPDKICDQISDAVLDHCLSLDKSSRVACEVLFKGQDVVIAGEITSSAKLNEETFAGIVRKVLLEANYNHQTLGCRFDDLRIHNFISQQSPDIARGVDGEKLGAGDQGLMFGYACRESPELMPFGIYYCHRLMEAHKELVKSNPGTLGPDAKCQLSVKYENGAPVEIVTVVFSSQHYENISQDVVTELLVDGVVKKVIPEIYLKNTKYLINPTGRFVIGGPVADCGLTGRKIIVDTYGGYARHGGGAFSGKDPTKVDRSGAYMARHIAKWLVKNGYAERVETQLAYCIGVPEPVSVYVNSFNTSIMPDSELARIVRDTFDLTPSGIISSLDLLNQKYLETASFGHFGRLSETSFSWER